MFVIARNSTFSYKGKQVKVQQVAEELGVRYVLEGSVRKSEDRLRITAQLIDAITGRHLWAERYDRDLKDIFALQDEITLKILNALRVKLNDGMYASLTEKGTNNLEAYLKLLQAREYGSRSTKEGNAMQRKLAEEVITLDPDYPIAYLSLSATHLIDLIYGTSKSPEQSLRLAEELVQKALTLDNDSAWGHGFLGRIYLTKRQHEKAITQSERAVALDPNSDFALAALAFTLRNAGRHEEGIALFKKAIRLNPIPPPWYLVSCGFSHLILGQYEEATVAFKKALQRSPENLFAHLGLAATYSALGREKDAHAEAEEILRIDPTFTLEAFAKGVLFKNQADIDRTIEALRKAGLPDKPPLPLPDKPSIAVLPFTNMSEDPKQEYFSDGITEEIITALSKTPKLFVIARNSTFTYKGKPTKVQKVGRELGVKYVLEGSVRKAGNKVRITAQLVDAKTGNHIWAERYDRDLKDIFALQDEITLKIVTAMQVKLTEGERARIYGRGTNNLEAYFKVLEGREQSSRFNKDGNAMARQMFEQAIALDPNYAMAYWRLSATHLMDLILGSTKSPKGSLKQAEELVEKALALDGALCEAHALLGRVYLAKRQYEQAIAEGERAIAIDPNSPIAQYTLAFSLTRVGKHEEAIALYKKAMHSDPIPSPSLLTMLGNAYIFAGRHEDGISTLKKVLHRSPDNLVAHVGLVIGYNSSGRDEEARNEAIEILRIDPKFSLEHFGKRLMYKDKIDTDRVVGALRKAGLK
ncbi:MAG: tetratricopeptide repeat protein [Thermodesulfobacteriota bacterium]|nr:tetratricopeptide repeat protein [Thermodesulfobacteriota bacterium]